MAERERGCRSARRSGASAADSVLERLAAALAAYATVKETQTDTKREPKDRGKHTKEPEPRFGDMLPGLETDHLRMIRG